MLGILLNEECKAATGREGEREREEEGERKCKEGSTVYREREREGNVGSKQLTMHELGRVRIGEISGEIN